jgi:prevent-host-death family protein
MKPELISATELRVKTRQIMERVKYKGQVYLVQTFGQPTAVILSVETFNHMLEECREHNPAEFDASLDLTTVKQS